MAFLSNPWVMFALCSLTMLAVIVVIACLLSALGFFRAGRRQPDTALAPTDQPGA